MVKIALENVAEAVDVQWGFQLLPPSLSKQSSQVERLERRMGEGSQAWLKGMSPARWETSSIIWEARPTYGTN